MRSASGLNYEYWLSPDLAWQIVGQVSTLYIDWLIVMKFVGPYNYTLYKGQTMYDLRILK